jgi:valyl-tRNA synthetase
VADELEDHFAKFRLSDALMTLYKLIWDDFCSCFLEVVKPPYQQPIDAKSYAEIYEIFEDMLEMLHPFMPFITEELWHGLASRTEEESIMITDMPQYEGYSFDQTLIDRYAEGLKIVENIRRLRAEKEIAPKEPLELWIKNSQAEADSQIDAMICKLSNLSAINYTDTKMEQVLTFIVQNIEYYVPFSAHVNVEEEIAKLEADLAYTEGFLQSVMNKLSNEKFVKGAPAQVVAGEEKKKADAQEKITMIKAQIAEWRK